MNLTRTLISALLTRTCRRAMQWAALAHTQPSHEMPSGVELADIGEDVP